MGLTKLSIKRPVSTILIIIGIVVFGVISIFNFDLELIPDIDMPMMMIMTTYPGADPDSVDELVTTPIEDSSQTLSGVDSVLSYSRANYSIVALTYDYDQDMNDAYTDLSAALDAMDLPDDAQDPLIIQMDVNAMATMMISASNDGNSDMMAYLDDTVVPQLESLTNVAQVEITGGRENYIRVQLDEEKMKQYGLTISGIGQMIAAADYNVPAGSVSAGNQDVSISASSSFDSLQDLENTTLTTGTGAIITLADVADVSLAAEEASSISQYDGQDNVTIEVTKVQSASTVTTCNDVKDEINSIIATNPGIKFDYTYDSGAEIMSSLKSIAETLVLGVILAMIVIFIFFGEWKASIIVGSSMPVSIFATLDLMSLFGFDMNIITMGALVIAIGMIVDSSIVVIESCFRLKEKHPDFKEAALKGCGIVAMSITASTITTIVVYLPMCMINGMAGQMFSQLGLIIVFAMVASLICAMTVVPLLFVLVKPQEKKDIVTNHILDKVKAGYDKLLRKLLYRRKTTILVSILLLVVSGLLASTLDIELIPSSYDGSITITATFRSGTKLTAIQEGVQVLTDAVEADENFEDYSLSISDNAATITTYAVDDCKRTSEKAVDEYMERFGSLTNMDISIEPSGSSSSMMSSYISSGNSIAITLEADDLDSLNEASDMVVEAMEQTPGVVHVSSDSANSKTTTHVVIDPLKAADAGLTPAAVAGDLYYTLTGMTAATMEYNGSDYDIILNYPDGTYETENDLMNKTLTGMTGKSCVLSDIASLETDEQLQLIQKSDGRYQGTITAIATSTAKSKASDSIDAAIKKMNFPEGVEKSKSYVENMRGENLTALMEALFAAIFLVFLVMAMQFESPRFSLMVMTCIPFSLIGSFFMLFICGNSLNMVSLMGFLMLMGIVVNNGILIVDTANQQREEMSIEDALVEAGKLRLRPILMTTLTTILAMVPMAFFSSNEMMQGMAVVIIGGLVASTLLCLLLMPTYYLMIDKRARKERRERRKNLSKNK